MVRAQNLRLASLILSHCRQRQRQRHHHWGCCLMAAASSASSSLFQARSFPNLNRTNHCFQFLSLSYSLSSSSSASSLSISSSFVLTVCCSEKRTVNGSNNNCIDNSVSHNSDSLRKAWAFDPRLPNLIRDSEIGPQDSCNPSLIDSQEGRNHRGRSPGFRDGPPLPEKIVVAVDVDEVLGNFVSALNRFIADRYSLIHSVSEYHVYEFFKIWNCSRDEADIRVHEFFKTPYFKMGIHPIPGARQALHKLSRFCTLSIVTSRQNAIKDHTIEWIEKHYPGLFQDIHFGNHFALDGQSRPKSDICRSLGAKVLIDDNPRYAIECAEAGIRVLLFDYEDSYPWCKTEAVNQHPLVTKVNNWEEVEQNLLSWVVS